MSERNAIIANALEYLAEEIRTESAVIDDCQMTQGFTPSPPFDDSVTYIPNGVHTLTIVYTKKVLR